MSLIDKYCIDEEIHAPLLLGSAIKVPGYAHTNWGIIDPEHLRRFSGDDGYRVEWEAGSKKQMQYVIDAITRTGLGNYSQKLRDKNAEIVTHVIANILNGERVNFLEPGAGRSTMRLYDELEKEGVDLERIFATLVEPSKERVREAADDLRNRGLKENKDFAVIVGTDQDMPKYIEPGSQDIVSYVATLHHHSFTDCPLAICHTLLKEAGVISIADWHNSMWEHPARVYELLKDIARDHGSNWPNAARDLARFSERYPKALKSAPEDPLNQASNDEINRFWREGWIPVRLEAIERGEFDPRDNILMLEAHRPVERQIEDMKKVGLRPYGHTISQLIEARLMNSNPDQLVESSRMLMETVGIKSII